MILEDDYSISELVIKTLSAYLVSYSAWSAEKVVSH